MATDFMSRLPGATIAGLVAAVAVAPAISAAGDTRDRAAATVIAQAAPSSPPDGVRTFQWRSFSSSPGGFQVEFPGRPEVSKRKIRTEIGDVVSVRHTAGDGAHATYDVTYNEYPKGSVAGLSPQKLLTAARDSLVQQSKGRLLSEKTITLGTAAGRECEIAGGDGMRYDLRLFFSGNRMYQIVAMAQPPARPDTRKFFESFRLTGTR